MIGKLIDRPVAVMMSLLAVIILGIVSFNIIPVSLAPDVDIPRITVNVTAPDMGARELSEAVVKPLRQQLMQVNRLKDISMESGYGNATVEMTFDHGADIDYLFIEVNEKVDQIMSSIPKDIERPKVIKASATDIPAFFLNAYLKDSKAVDSVIYANLDSDGEFMQFTEFASEVLTKRIEQLPQVAMVDISGLLAAEILIIPDRDKFLQLGITENDIENAIRGANIRLGNLTIRDGEYRYSIRFRSDVTSKEDVANIYLKIQGRLYRISDLAKVVEKPQERSGYILSDGREAISIAVIKQSDARMADLKDGINELLESFQKEYPDVEFTLTRDQTALLDYSIDNLIQNIVVGCLLACIIVLIFLGDYRSSLLVIITMPTALVLSMLFFYIVGLSMNIISLSGLVLGVGMMSDNSVIVLDNIMARRKRGEPLRQAVVLGTSEVFAPMLSSVLTTCSVFVPLIFLSGMAGALFYDQAISVAITLFASLAVTMLLIPVLYYLFYKSGEKKKERVKRGDFFDVVIVRYEKALKWTFRHRGVVFSSFGIAIILSILLFRVIDKEQLPQMTYDDMVVRVEWNQQISADENLRRTLILIGSSGEYIDQSTVLSGAQQFILSHSGQNDAAEALIYIKAFDARKLSLIKDNIAGIITADFPAARYSYEVPDNIFDMIFSDKEASLVARLRMKNGRAPEPAALNRLLENIGSEFPDIRIESAEWEEHVLYIARPEIMALYDVGYSELQASLRNALNSNRLFTITQGRLSVPVVIGDNKQSSEDIFQDVKIVRANSDIPVSLLMKQTMVRDFKTIVSGAEGDYYPVNMEVDRRQIVPAMSAIRDIVSRDGAFEVDFSGSYFSNREMIGELIIILMIALILLYLILASQFESLIQPIIILSEIGINIFGALATLAICGATLNIMSLIGMVVMSGIVINDSILKVDTINKLRKSGYSLIRSIMEGGRRRLKPIIMTSLTTIFAVVPFLYGHDMGSDLQRPMSLTIIGGMVTGTMASVFLIPVLYYQIYFKRRKK